MLYLDAFFMFLHEVICENVIGRLHLTALRSCFTPSSRGCGSQYLALSPSFFLCIGIPAPLQRLTDLEDCHRVLQSQATISQATHLGSSIMSTAGSLVALAELPGEYTLARGAFCSPLIAHA
jgi:hypothetical protein